MFLLYQCFNKRKHSSNLKTSRYSHVYEVKLELLKDLHVFAYIWYFYVPFCLYMTLFTTFLTILYYDK